MAFTLADLIVIGIVVIILVAYRQLDRNNRSLEKVKRYALKVQDDLEIHVQNKVVAIKDMGIELEVHQKAAKEVLKRVQAIERGLNSRSSDIERIGERISDYDSALDELVRMTERAEENIGRVRDESAYVDGVGRRIKQSQEKIQSVEHSIDTIIEQFQARNLEHMEDVQAKAFTDAEERAAGFHEELAGFQERLNQFSEYVRGVEQRGEAVAERTKEQLDEALDTVVNRAHEATIQSSEHLGEIREQLELLESDYQKRLLQLAEKGEKLETTALAKLRTHIEGRTRDVAKELSDRLDNHKRALVERFASVQGEVQTGLAEIDQRSTKLEESRVAVENRIASFGTELHKRIDTSAQEVERTVLGSVEQRLSEYENQIAYRFEKIEHVGKDVEELEDRLRESMDQVAGQVREEFEQFSREIVGSRQAERSKIDDSMSRVREQMADLETGLLDLKNQAYENVSEKLKGFEDEFLADLKDRQVGMEHRLAEWQTAFQQEADELAQQGHDDRTQIEQAYDEELQRRLNELSAETNAKFETFQEEIVAFQQAVQARVGSSNELIESLQRDLDEQFDQLSAESKSGLRDQFTKHREQIGSELRELERVMQEQLSDLGSRFEAGAVELEGTLEQSRSEAALWKTQVDQRLQSASADVNQQIADFRVQIGDTLSEMRLAFSADRDQSLEESAAERSRLQEELDTLSEQVQRLSLTMQDRTNEALSEFDAQYQALRLDFERREKTVGADSDARIKEFRTFVNDTRDQFAAMQEKLYGKLTEESEVLAANLGEIDRRQQNFVEQTKIFERADSLKSELQKSITELRADVDRVDAQRKEIREIESQFSRLRKSADEVGDKMARFVAEKRRIDVLEDDYKKLMGMSQSVEIKLDHVTASNDTLQNMQASLRSLEDLQKDVETRFQRLEKKRGFLDLTSEGVDKNFQVLQEVEQRLGEISSQLDSMPGKVEELSGRIQQLASNKRDSDAAMKQLALLDQTMEEIEERMENLNSAREWLARTETRLGDVQHEAEEQVKLLGAIMKQQTRDGAPGDGAPPVTTRDTVIKLARQSWNVDEIARATSLSRGEVELILELSTK